MLPASEEIAHLVRMSGKSVFTSTSITPQAWFRESPRRVPPIAVRTWLRAPSQPTAYRARTTRSSPTPSPVVRRSVATTGCVPDSSTLSSASSQP